MEHEKKREFVRRGSLRVVGAALLAATLFSIGSLAVGQQASGPESPKLGAAAPEFALANIEGKRVQLKDYRGKKNILLVFYPALFRAGG